MENLPEDTSCKKPYRNMRKSQPLRRSSDRIMQQASAFVASLEIIGDGVILLDGNAQISFSSQSARLILDKVSEFIDISDSQLRFVDSSSQQLLNVALDKVRAQAQGETISVNEVLVMARPGLRRPLVLSLCSLSSAGEEPRLMLIFRDPDMESTQQWQVFSRYFNLTAQEARVCLALVDGLSINEYSERFYLSPHTVRTHLKAVFAKTVTRRQSDLLRLIFAFTRL